MPILQYNPPSALQQFIANFSQFPSHKTDHWKVVFTLQKAEKYQNSEVMLIFELRFRLQIGEIDLAVECADIKII